MNASDIASQISESPGLSKIAAMELVDDVFAAAVDAAAKGDELSIPGFGKFKVQSRPER